MIAPSHSPQGSSLLRGPFIRLLLLLVAGCSWSTAAEAADALWAVNRMRAAIGLYPLQSDPRLAMNAQRTADYMARRNMTGHTGMHRRVARAEGTGNRSGYDPQGLRFYACMMNTRNHRYAGAATACARGKTFYVLQLR